MKYKAIFFDRDGTREKG